jgi:GNAT superfamily N-acetyltransferase
LITVTEEPYDGPVAVSLVAALHAEIDERYADELDRMTEEEVAADHADYLAEVTPELASHPLGTFLVAWLDGRPVGCGALKPLDGLAGVAEIKRMYTEPAARRRGVSRALLERLERVAADLGYERIRLETGTAQPEAIALYESHGWDRITPYGRYKDEPSSVCFGKEVGRA